MKEIAIKVDEVSKQFKLPHEKQDSIKGLFLNIFNGKRTYEKQKVLKDITFDIKNGEFFGIVGRNGSGKSTLLKLLAGIYSPDKGHIKVNGGLTPFIELGVGFSPELTGRENVYLNGALLGFNRKEMDAMYEEIVEFAELEKFMDQKLKNYSSGMQVRLAFSIAIRADTDILLLDEVLAVGDESFQKKCLDVFESYKAKNKTVILVTHDMNTVRKFCNRAMLIREGNIVSIGDPQKISRQYTGLNEVNTIKAIEKENKKTKINYSISLTDLNNKKKTSFRYGEQAVVRLEWPKIEAEVRGVGVAILKQNGEYVFGANTFLDKFPIGKKNKIDYKLKLDIGEGTYIIKSALFGKNDSEIVEYDDQGMKFMIKQNKEISWEGMVNLDHEWKN